MFLESAAFIVVLLFGVYLVALGLILIFAREIGSRFLLGFATSAFTHYLEISLRIVAGAALVLASPKMLFGQFFWAFGWILVISSLVMAVIPWRWHRHFAEKAVPPMVKYPAFVAIVSIMHGGFVIYSLLK